MIGVHVAEHEQSLILGGNGAEGIVVVVKRSDGRALVVLIRVERGLPLVGDIPAGEAAVVVDAQRGHVAVQSADLLRRALARLVEVDTAVVVVDDAVERVGRDDAVDVVAELHRLAGFEDDAEDIVLLVDVEGALVAHD